MQHREERERSTSDAQGQPVGERETDTAGVPVPLSGDLVRAFAEAIVRPGGRALLLHADNARDRWVDIREAAESSRPFAVEVSPDVLAVDVDDPDLVPKVYELRDRLQAHGYHPVLITSGQPGHLHLLCRVADPEHLETYKQAAKTARFDVRYSIRPPGAPHRLGLPVQFLDPVDPLVALAALRATAPPQLSPRMNRLLRTGDNATLGYKSRSEMHLALALAAVNAGWTERQLLDVLLDPLNAAGERLRERSRATAQREVRRCWTKALARSTEYPAIRDREAARREIGRIRSLVEASPWRGRGGASAWAVLNAHLEVAGKLGKLTYHLDIRTVAQRAGLAPSTVTVAYRRLRDGGWLKLSEIPRGALAAVWTLKGPRLGGTEPNIPISGPPSIDTNMPISLRGCEEECSEQYRVENSSTVQSDAWRWRGLGKSALRVWRLLCTTHPKSEQALAGRLHIGPQMTRRHLVRLAAAGLAVRGTDGAWHRRSRDLDQVAADLGTFGARAEQEHLHKRERENHAAYLAKSAWPSRLGRTSVLETNSLNYGVGSEPKLADQCPAPANEDVQGGPGGSTTQAT